jgi:thioredoxin 1
MSKKAEFTDANFGAEVVSSNLPVLVDFWAPWCGPCRIVDPIVEEIAGQYEGKLKVGKLNTDDNRETAATYGVMSIPTIIIFKNGKEKERIVGAQPKRAIVEKIDKVLTSL